MSELFRVRQHAGPGTRFGPEAFAAMIGSIVPVTLPSDRVADAILKTASVCDEGAYVELILEVPDGTLPSAALVKYGIGA